MNQRIIHNLVQGTPEWAAFRLEHDGASEAAAAMGLSKKATRSELLRIKHTGIAKEFSDWIQEHILAKGHEVEEAARPLIVELIGEPLFPVTMSYGRLSASCDGITMGGETAFEHKQWNEELAAAVRRKELPQEHQPQCQQIMHVTGAERVIFTVSDGTPNNLVWMEVLPDPAWVKRIEAAWVQFHEDLKTYTPPEVIPAAVAEVQETLPALSVEVTGGVTVRDNLAVFGDALRAYIERQNRKPETDQDFANLDAAAKRLREVQAKVAAARDSALGQVSSIDSIKRLTDELEEVARAAAVEFEKLVKAEKENRRNAIINSGMIAIESHVSSLNTRLGKPYMPRVVGDFGAAVKGLKTISSIQNAVDTELARVKIEANEIADRIDINLAWLRENAKDYAFLFADTATIVLKQKDDFEALAKLRISEHKEAEAKRIEAETARIRAEEEAKAAAKVKAEQDAAALAAQQNTAPAVAGNTEPVANAPAANEETGETPAPGQRETPQDTGKTIKLGEIGERLGFTVTAEFLKLLGFTFTTEKAAKNYRMADFPRICAAIARHCDAVGSTSMQRAA